MKRLSSRLSILLCAGILSVLPSNVFAQDYTSDLVAHWTLDETSGSLISDSSNGNDGTWRDNDNNNVVEETTTGLLNTALTFDGVDDAIINALDVGSLNDWTVAAWFRSSSTRAGNHTILGADSTSIGNEFRIYYNVNNNRFELRLADFDSGGNTYATSATGLFDGDWHHIVVTGDYLNEFNVYIDGALVSTHALSGSQVSSGTDPDPYAIGASRDDGPSYKDFFDGALDDVRYYNRVLTAEDITALYAYHGEEITCTNPNAVTGTIYFNDDLRVMQYCNGTNWGAIGKPGIPNNGLSGHWRLDETSGTTAADSSDFGNDGTMTSMDGASNTVAGKDETALSFSGGSRITAAASATNIDDIFNGGGSISYWIYPINWGTFGRVIDKSDSGSYPPNSGWHSQGTGTTVIFSQAFSGGTGQWDIGGVALNTWSHITIIYDNTDPDNDPTFYLNGVEQALSSDSNSTGTPVSDAGNPITLGSRQGGGNSYTGYIDDVRVYNRPLAAIEVQSLYSATSPVCTAPGNNLVGHWTLDETSGTTASDSSANTNHGALQGSMDAASDTTSGPDGTALNFDGIDDYIAIPYDSSLELTNTAGTVTAWIRLNASNIGQDQIWPVFWKQEHTNIFNPGGYMLHAHQSGPSDQIYLAARLDGTQIKDTTTPLAAATWYHVAMVWDDTNVWLYINDNIVHTGTMSGNIHYEVNARAVIGFGPNPGGSHNYADGIIDDVRVYDHALSTTEISALYGAVGGTCSVHACYNPFQPKGTILFNTDYDVMQYCNGADWIAMGPQGDGGGGCSNPTGLQAELRYNSDYNTLQYCEGDEWVSVISSYDSIPISGLIGYWPFDDGAGTTATDATVNGNDGTFINTPTWTTGQVGGALSFDSSDSDRIDLPNNAYDSLTAQTVTAWVYQTDNTGFQQIFFSTNDWHEFAINNGAIEMYQGSICSPRLRSRSAETVPLNTWTHIAFTTGPSGNAFYINGTPTTNSYFSGDSSTNAPFSACDNGTRGYRIGGYSSGSENFDGIIDEVRLYNRALSATEVSMIYTAGNASETSTGLIGHWTLDETSGLSIADSSGSNNDGTWSDGSGNDVAEETGLGAINTALTFDGSNDYIDIGNPADYQITESVTVAAWVNSNDWSEIKHFVSKQGNGGGSANYGWRLATSGASSPFAFGVSETGATMIDRRSTITPTTDTWYHVAGVYDSSAQTIDVYVNGVLNNGTLSGTVPASQNNSSVNVNIGRRSAGNRYFDGEIDDVQIYNEPLNASEIASIYCSSDPMGNWNVEGNIASFGSTEKAITRLDSSTIVVIDDSAELLTTYSWDGTDWSQVGNTLSIPGINNMDLATLDSSTIVLGDYSLDTYSWDGTDWSHVGNSFASNSVNVVALNSNTIAAINYGGSEDLATYSWDGTDWSQVGNSLSLGVAAWPSITSFDSDTVVISTDDSELLVFDWDGTDWTQVGSTYTMSDVPVGNRPGIVAMDSSTIVHSSEENTRIYEWDGSTWTKRGGYYDTDALGRLWWAKLNGNDYVTIDISSDTLRTLRYTETSCP